MTGNHLMWKDLCGDELLSYSKDPLFLVVHGLRRYHELQGNVTIQFLDRRQAKTPKGDPAKFYIALDIYTELGVPKWSGWEIWAHSKLHPRKFTQEFLTHGVVIHHGTQLKQARVEDLIRDGLYQIFPEFDAAADHKRAGLYTLQVVYRKVGYPPRAQLPGETNPPIYSYDGCPRAVAMTPELLETVRAVTMNFRKVPEGVDASTIEPPLHAFISFLTFEKRQRGDPVFTRWIKSRYTADEVLDLYTDSEGNPLPGMTAVANNLPGYMQYLDLIRDCIEAFSLRPLPPNVVETAHAFDGTMDRPFSYAAYDSKQHRLDVKSELYVTTRHQEQQQKARARRERKAKAKIEAAKAARGDADPSGDEDEDEDEAAEDQSVESEIDEDPPFELGTLEDSTGKPEDVTAGNHTPVLEDTAQDSALGSDEDVTAGNLTPVLENTAQNSSSESEGDVPANHHAPRNKDTADDDSSFESDEDSYVASGVASSRGSRTARFVFGKSSEQAPRRLKHAAHGVLLDGLLGTSDGLAS